MNNSLSTGGGDMLNTKEFRARMVHAAFNGEETDYQKVISGVDKTAPFWFVLGLMMLVFALLPILIVIFLEGFAAIGSFNPMFVLSSISTLCFIRSYFRGKTESLIAKKKYQLMDYEYTLNPKETEYLMWYRFNIKRDTYPVYIIESMLSNIDRHEYVNNEYINPLNDNKEPS